MLTVNGRLLFGMAIDKKHCFSSVKSCYWKGFFIDSNNITSVRDSNSYLDKCGDYYIKLDKVTDICDMSVNLSEDYDYAFGLVVGENDTAETPLDYTITNSGLTCSGTAFDFTGTDYVFKISTKLSNNMSNDIPLKEIGLGLFTSCNSSGSLVKENFLLFRKVLTEEVIVPSKGTLDIDLKIK